MSSISERLERGGIDIPAYQPLPESAPMVTHVRSGDHLYLSGHIPDIAGEERIRGQLGRELEVADGARAARAVARNLLATLVHAVGRLDDVERVVKLLGMVNSTSGFVDQPAVVNAASDVFVLGWGPERGRHVRSAIGVAQLPFGVPVEIELVVRIGGDAK